MASRFRFVLMAVVALLALPTFSGAQGQTGSGPSLQDTLNWLRDFVPTATGGIESQSLSEPVRTTASIALTGGCGMIISLRLEDPSGAKSPGLVTGRFSLSDVDPASISVSGNLQVSFTTRGLAKVVAQDHHPNAFPWYGFSMGTFSDKASAQRVVNALQHAAQLCANSQPF